METSYANTEAVEIRTNNVKDKMSRDRILDNKVCIFIAVMLGTISVISAILWLSEIV